MQVMVNSLEKKVDEAEKKYVESEKVSEERLKKAKEAETKVEQLKDSLQRFLIFFYLLQSFGLSLFTLFLIAQNSNIISSMHFMLLLLPCLLLICKVLFFI
jgi:hypothetical protein